MRWERNCWTCLADSLPGCGSVADQIAQFLGELGVLLQRRCDPSLTVRGFRVYAVDGLSDVGHRVLHLRQRLGHVGFSPLLELWILKQLGNVVQPGLGRRERVGRQQAIGAVNDQLSLVDECVDGVSDRAGRIQALEVRLALLGLSRDPRPASR